MEGSGVTGGDPSSATEPTPARADELPSGKRAPRPGLVRIFPPRGEAPPLVFQVRAEATLGRSSQNALCLPDAHASRHHAKIRRAPDGLIVWDLKSRHGTFVDGVRLGSDGTPASFGSVIRVGDTLFLVAADVTAHEHGPHRLKANFLGVPEDVLAGPTLLQTWNEAGRAASVARPILIVGESGAGKEVVARLVHSALRKPAPFVALNVAAVPAPLFESELFGHARGAFTGATEPRAGAFRDASGGVLFLDEVGELTLDLQAKLLRAIDQMRVRPVGSRDEFQTDARLVTATNRDLPEQVAAGRFRADLYHRLASVVIRVPPLRERRDEILFLAAAMVEKDSSLPLSADAAERLVLGRWDGNARELGRVVWRAAESARREGRSEITAEDLPEVANDGERTELTAEALLRAMQQVGGNATAAAKALGVSRATLYNTFRRLQLDPRNLRTGS